MDWARLFADAVDYAAGGFPVAPRVAHDWAKQTEKLKGNKGASQHLLFDGKAPVTGDRITLAALGRTLERIAREGSAAFYQGEIADEMAATVQALGGVLSAEDLADCRADWVEPISTSYHGHDILEIPPNGQGITALILLNLIRAANSEHKAGSAAQLHEMIEFARIAYAMRDVHVADGDHLQARIADILSAETTAGLLSQFDPVKRNADILLPDLPDSDTVYLSVVDRDGRAVSFINSVYSGFGTGIVTENSGIALQDRGTCFSLKPGHPNALEGGKRPLHTIIPAMAMKDGRPSICFGVMGGAYQPMGQAHVLVNMLEYGMDPQAALDAPRVFWDEAGTIRTESGISGDVFAALQSMGHPMGHGGLHGGGQIIRIDNNSGTLIAGSDPRKDGQAGGY
jgi:gamma-glutamyltranspeptidase/glutathione hydrolase